MLSDKLISGLIVMAVVIVLALVFFRVKFGPDGGINPFRVRCPNCRAKMPYIRLPLNERQEMWGGWTCFKCGTEMDKWGRKIDLELK